MKRLLHTMNRCTPDFPARRFRSLLLMFFLSFSCIVNGLNVALIGNNGNANIVTYLSANGFSVTDFGSTIPSAAVLSSYNAVVLLRTWGNSDLAAWVINGGVLITEWDAAGWPASAGLLSVTATFVGGVGGNTPVTFENSTLGNQLGSGLSNPYSDGGATEYFYNFTGLGSGVQVIAIRPTNLPAIVGGPSGAGFVFLIGYDWADGFPSTSSNSGILLKNTLNADVGGSSAPASPTSVSVSVNPVCNGFSTQLTANGAVGTVYWYSGSCGTTGYIASGSPVTVSPSNTTTYYARNYNNLQYSAGCASATVTVNQPSYVGTTPTVASLQATGSGIQWYAAASGGSPLATSASLINGNHYYASQTVNGVESATRLDVTANVDATPCKPTGTASQTYSAGATVASLQATGSNIRWYSASSGGAALPTSTVLVNGTHYYATQTINCTESATRFDVTVVIN